MFFFLWGRVDAQQMKNFKRENEREREKNNIVKEGLLGLFGSQESEVQTDFPVTMHVHLLHPSPLGYTLPEVYLAPP